MFRQIFLSIFIVAFVASSTQARTRSHYMASKRAKFTSLNEYDFKSCQQYNSDKDEFSYNVYCINGSESIINHGRMVQLQGDMNRLSRNTYKEYLLRKLKDSAVDKISQNRSAANEIIKCANKTSEKCRMIMDRIKAVIKVQLPELRQSMALMDMDHSQKVTKEIEHDDHTHLFGLIGEKLGSDVPKLSEVEEERAKLKLESDKKIAKHNVYSTSKCLSIEDGVYKQKKTHACRRQLRGGISVRNKINAGVKDLNRKQYETILSTTPFLSYIKTHPSKLDTDKTLETQIANAFKKLDEKMLEKYNHLINLQGNDRIELLAYSKSVDSLIDNYGDGQKVLCDTAQSLKNHMDGLENMKLAGMIGASIAGAAFCGLTAGIGCAVTAAVLTETAFVADSQAKYDKAMEDYASGLVDMETLSEAHNERNISLLAAPTSLVGTGIFKASGEAIKRTTRSTASARQATDSGDEILDGRRGSVDRRNRPEDNPRRKGERRFDDHFRQAIDTIKDDLGDARIKKMQDLYNPGNVHGLEGADTIFLAGVADQIEKSYLKNNQFTDMADLRDAVKKELKDIIDECKGAK